MCICIYMMCIDVHIYTYMRRCIQTPIPQALDVLFFWQLKLLSSAPTCLPLPPSTETWIMGNMVPSHSLYSDGGVMKAFVHPEQAYSFAHFRHFAGAVRRRTVRRTAVPGLEKEYFQEAVGSPVANRRF